MKYFVIIAYLNLLDGFITYFGLRHQLIEEANPLMDWLWVQGPIYFLLSKIILSILALLLGVYFQPKRYMKQWKYTLLSVCTLYSCIILMHLYWVSLVMLNGSLF